jgi:hypothetical protein
MAILRSGRLHSEKDPQQIVSKMAAQLGGNFLFSRFSSSSSFYEKK